MTIAIRHRSILLLCAIGVLCSPPSVAGQVGLSLGGEYGFGAIARVGTDAQGIEVGAGFTPVLVFGREQLFINGESVLDEVFFDAFFPATVGAKVNFRVRGSEDGTRRTAVEFGVSYNELIELGFGGGVEGRISDRVLVSGGLMFYSKAADQLADKISEVRGLPVDEFELAFLVNYQPYVSFSILLF